jgi:hypothetical protein
MNVLRILTPEEINEFITASDGRKRVALTDLLCGVVVEEDAEETSAKILPFRRQDEIEEELVSEVVELVEAELVYEVGSRVNDLLTKNYKEFRKSELSLLANKRRPKKIKKTKESSTFVIDERKKFEGQVAALRSREVLTLYRKNAAVDVELQRASHDDLMKSSQSGVLINKKQA